MTTQAQQLTNEDALSELQGDEYAQEQYRFLSSWFGLTPRQALRRLLRERAYQTVRDTQQGNTDSEWREQP